jgi:hypothetical protein
MIACVSSFIFVTHDSAVAPISSSSASLQERSRTASAGLPRRARARRTGRGGPRPVLIWMGGPVAVDTVGFLQHGERLLDAALLEEVLRERVQRTGLDEPVAGRARPAEDVFVKRTPCATAPT